MALDRSEACMRAVVSPAGLASVSAICEGGFCVTVLNIDLKSYLVKVLQSPITNVAEYAI